MRLIRKMVCLCLSIFILAMAGCSEDAKMTGSYTDDIRGIGNRCAVKHGGVLYISEQDPLDLSDDVITSNGNLTYVGKTSEIYEGSMTEHNSYKIQDDCEIYYDKEKDQLYVRISRDLYQVLIESGKFFSELNLKLESSDLKE